MAPIHDTDLAESRWSQGEWENYELWEKVEQRQRRKKRIWLLLTFVVFLVLSSVPIVMERWDKWMSRSIVRVLSQRLNEVKREAILSQSTVRLRFLEEGKLVYVVERVEQCDSPSGIVVSKGRLVHESIENQYTWMHPKVGSALEVPGLVDNFCYDPMKGAGFSQSSENIVGFGILPVKDLAEKRLDRMSILLLSGPSGESSFD